jgi:hypothetical protein
LCFFEPTWLFYTKYNLSKTIYFVKRTWFLYVLSKFQFKILQWNAKLWAQNNPLYLTSIINFNYSIPLSSFHNTTKWNEFFSLKGTTFVYVLSSDWWISGLTPKCKNGYAKKNVWTWNKTLVAYQTKSDLSVLLLWYFSILSVSVVYPHPWVTVYFQR